MGYPGYATERQLTLLDVLESRGGHWHDSAQFVWTHAAITGAIY
jgi:hypothetical protein